MPEFRTELGGVSGGVGSLTPMAPSTKGDARDAIIANTVSNFAQGVGRGFARAQGERVAGTGTTNVEVEGALESFDKVQGQKLWEVEDGLESFESDMTPGQIADARAEAIKEVGTDAKKLQALVSSGRISSTEAQARMNGLIRQKLSNPLLAMFEQEFANAASSFTGGRAGTGGIMFSPSPEEQKAAIEAKARAEALAAFEEEVTAKQLRTGFDRNDIAKYMQETSAAELRTKHSEATLPAMFGDTNRVAKANVYDQISKMWDEKQLLDPAKKQVAERMVEDYRFAMSQTIDKYPISVQQKNAYLTTLANETQGLKAFINAHDQSALAQEAVKFAETSIKGITIKNMPAVYAMAQIHPDLGKVALNSMGERNLVAFSNRYGFPGIPGMVDNTEQFATQAVNSFLTIVGKESPFESDNTAPGAGTYFLTQPEAMNTIKESAKEDPAVLERMKMEMEKNPQASLDGLTSSKNLFDANNGDEQVQQMVKDAVSILQNQVVGASALYGLDPIQFQERGFKGTGRQARIPQPRGFVGDNADHPAYQTHYEKLKRGSELFAKSPWIWKGKYDNHVDAYNAMLRGEDIFNDGQAEAEVELPTTLPENFEQNVSLLREQGVTPDDVDRVAEGLGLTGQAVSALRGFFSPEGS